MKTIRLFALAAALVIVTGCANVQNDNFLKVQGPDIVTPDGDKFLIRGTNLGNWLNPEGYMFLFQKASSVSRINQAFCEMVGPDFTAEFWRIYLENYITEDDIKFLASTGINSIRLPFHYKLFTDDEYMGYKDPEMGFVIFDRLIEWCRESNLYIILDMHDAPGGQTGDNIDDSYGYPWLFESPESERLFIDVWVKIAERYRNEPMILGYDLINEPIAHYFDNKEELNAKLEPLYMRTVEAIRKVDQNHIIILGGPQWNSRFDMFTNWTFDDNIMYSCHRYGGATDADAIRSFIEFRDMTNLPMYMGETGENTDEWIRSLRMTMEENNIGWHYWPYKKLRNSTSFVHIPVPDDWEVVRNFAESPRTHFGEIREARPDQEKAREVLMQYLENCLFENCVVNTGYVDALTK